MLLSKKNVLLLDEPTNHLDFETVEALGQALNGYNGTIFFVSHDRTFVSMLATDVIDVSDGKIVHYPGTYEDYVYHIEQRVREDLSNGEDARKKVQKAEKKKSAYHLRKELNAEINKLKKEISRVEERIAGYEKERNAIVEIFSLNPESYSVGQNKRLDELTRLIEQEESTWFGHTESLEELQRRQKQV